MDEKILSVLTSFALEAAKITYGANPLDMLCSAIEACKCAETRPPDSCVPLQDVPTAVTSVLNPRALDVFRQWFDALQDCNPAYLTQSDYLLARNLYKELGMRVPDSIEIVVQRPE